MLDVWAATLNGLTADATLHPLASLLLRATLCFSLAAALVLALRHALHRLGASLAYQSWLLVPLLSILPVCAALLPSPGPTPLPSDLRALGHGISALTSVPAPAREGHALFWLLTAWAAGATAGALVLLTRQRRYRRELTFDRIAGAWRAPDARSPALLGFWRPRLVLPNDFGTRFDADEQALILSHEAVHRRRLDNCWNAVAAAGLCLQWFNPIAHLAWRRMRIDQELSCDAAVVRMRPDDLVAYARALVKAQTGGIGSMLVCQMQLLRPRHPLTERIAMLKNHTPSHAAALAGRSLIAIAGTLLAGMAYAMQAGEPPAADPPIFYRLAVKLTVDDASHGDGRNFFVTEAGKPARITLTDKRTSGNTRWDVEIVPRPHADDSIDIRAVVRGGESLDTLARPRLIVKEGAPARVTISTADGGHQIALDIGGTRIDREAVDALTGKR